VEKLLNFSVTYDFTHFVIKNFFHQTNPLINERTLAARLGIDLAKTPSEVWERFCVSVLDDFRYKISGEKLAFLNAENRVKILQAKTGFQELVHASPLKFCTSSEFWSICEGFKVPIDPLEAFKIHTTADLKPWQESKVISLLAILEREGFVDRGIKPDHSEMERIEFIKKEIGL